jgi:hypothetical protein
MKGLQAAEIQGTEYGKSSRNDRPKELSRCIKNPSTGYRLFQRAELERFLAKIAQPKKPK